MATNTTALDHPWLAQPSPYDDVPGAVCPPNIGGCPELGTERPVPIAEQTIHEPQASSKMHIKVYVGAEGVLAEDVPERESDDIAVLAAWYSGFAYAEHYRKVVLAQCKEIVRADYAARDKKVTEERLKDLARTHPIYLDYLATHLHGRTLWEREFRAAGGLT